MFNIREYFIIYHELCGEMCINVSKLNSYLFPIRPNSSRAAVENTSITSRVSIEGRTKNHVQLVLFNASVETPKL